MSDPYLSASTRAAQWPRNHVHRAAEPLHKLAIKCLHRRTVGSHVNLADRTNPEHASSS